MMLGNFRVIYEEQPTPKVVGLNLYKVFPIIEANWRWLKVKAFHMRFGGNLKKEFVIFKNQLVFLNKK